MTVIYVVDEYVPILLLFLWAHCVTGGLGVNWGRVERWGRRGWGAVVEGKGGGGIGGWWGLLVGCF